jgi:hypothetical protein
LSEVGIIAKAAVRTIFIAPTAVLVIYYALFLVPERGWLEAALVFQVLPLTLLFNGFGVLLVAVPLTLWAEKWATSFRYVVLANAITAAAIAFPCFLTAGVDAELIRPVGFHILASAAVFCAFYWFFKSRTYHVEIV